MEGLQTPELDEGKAGREPEAFSAVQLFLQRARQVKRTFGQSPDELACVAHICRLVGGMPLAIELAAAWINVLSCGDILQEIQHNLTFLRTSLRDYPERHRDIRAVFDSSWNMLTEPERQLFRRLSVFRGGFTRAAAEAIGGEAPWTEDDLSLVQDGALQLVQRQPQVLAALARLVDKSFVRHTPFGRYEIHELMRQYGAAKLLKRPEEEREARDNHARYYLTFLVQQEAPLKGARQRQVLEMVAPEIENIKTAWNWAIARRRLDWLARMLPGVLWLFEIRNDFQEAALLTWHAVESFRRQRAPTTLARVDEYANFAFLLSQAGWFAFLSGRTERGRALSDEALSLVGPGSTSEHLWYMNAQRGYIELTIGNLADARRFSQRGLEHARELATPWYLGFPLAQLGMISLEEGDPESAYDRLQESLTLWIEVGDLRGLIFAYTHLGAATLALGKTQEALGYAEQSLALSIDANDRWSQANALNLIGRVQAARGDDEKANASFRESADLHREIGDRRGMALALVNLGNAALDAGEVDQARAAFLEALPPAALARAVATGLSAIVGLARVEVGGERPDWAHSLATYVAEHPQAKEHTRAAARQVCAEIEASVKVQRSRQADGRFWGDSFEEVVGSILAENP